MNEGAAGASSPNAAGLQPRLLALSCSADAVSVALVGLPDSPTPVIECWHEPVKAGRSDALLAMVDGLLRAGGVSARSVSHLVVDVGPGPFTALRVACSVAQGIGLACGASFVSVSSTEALALQSLQGQGAGEYTVMVSIDARMGEVYVASLRVELDARGQPLGLREVSPCTVVAPAGAWSAAGPGRAFTQPLTLYGAGNARIVMSDFDSMLGDQARQAGWSYQPAAGAVVPRADSVARLGLMRLRHSSQPRDTDCAAARLPEEPSAPWVSDSVPMPRYVRNKVALDRAEQAALRASASASARR